MSDFDFLTLLKYVAAIGGAITAIASITARGREFWCKRWRAWKRSNNLPRLVEEIHNDVREVKRKQEFFETELRTNGGASLKDEVRLLVMEATMERWDKPWPGFRTLQDGRNISVNQAYCELVGVRDPDILMQKSWEQFMADREQGDDFLHRWLDASASKSQFADTLKIQSVTGEYRGEWTVRIKPLGSMADGNYIFGGRYYPKDDKARQVASDNNWEL